MGSEMCIRDRFLISCSWATGVVAPFCVSRSGPYIRGSLSNICSPSLQPGSPSSPNGILVDWLVSRVVNMGRVNVVGRIGRPCLGCSKRLTTRLSLCWARSANVVLSISGSCPSEVASGMFSLSGGNSFPLLLLSPSKLACYRSFAKYEWLSSRVESVSYTHLTLPTKRIV